MYSKLDNDTVTNTLHEANIHSSTDDVTSAVKAVDKMLESKIFAADIIDKHRIALDGADYDFEGYEDDLVYPAEGKESRKLVLYSNLNNDTITNVVHYANLESSDDDISIAATAIDDLVEPDIFAIDVIDRQHITLTGDIYGDENDNYIVNYDDELAIYGVGGNNTIENSGNFVSIYGGTGNDSIVTHCEGCYIDGGSEGLNTIQATDLTNSYIKNAYDISLSGEEFNNTVETSGTGNIISGYVADNNDLIICDGFDTYSNSYNFFDCILTSEGTKVLTLHNVYDDFSNNKIKVNNQTLTYNGTKADYVYTEPVTIQSCEAGKFYAVRESARIEGLKRSDTVYVGGEGDYYFANEFSGQDSGDLFLLAPGTYFVETYNTSDYGGVHIVYVFEETGGTAVRTKETYLETVNDYSIHEQYIYYDAENSHITIHNIARTYNLKPTVIVETYRIGRNGTQSRTDGLPTVPAR